MNGASQTVHESPALFIPLLRLARCAQKVCDNEILMTHYVRSYDDVRGSRSWSQSQK
jgi:hypothetical protein